MERRFFVEGDRFSIRNITQKGEPEKFYFVSNTEPGKYPYKWSKDIPVNNENGPENITKLEPGRTGVLYQTIFGIRPNAYIYIAIPVDTRKGGIAEEAVPKDGLRQVGAITQKDSPYDFPDFITELFLQKDTSYSYPALYGYNPTNKPIRPELIFIINKVEMEQITDAETVDMMRKKRLSYRPIMLGWKER